MNIKIWNRLISSSILIALLFLQFSLCIAQQTTSDFVIGDKISFESKILNEKRIIVVIPPLNYKNHPDKKYPVVYVLDAGNNLFATHGIISYYSKMLEIIPRFICTPGYKCFSIYYFGIFLRIALDFSAFRFINKDGLVKRPFKVIGGYVR